MSKIETELFSKIKELYGMKIWDFLSEYHLIGVGLPGRRDPFYISTIGMGQDEYGFFVFKDNEALALLNDWLMDTDGTHLQAIGQDMLMIAFENREDLSKKDYNRVKESQITFRGKKAWPIILDFTPGYTVDTADEEGKMRQLTAVLDKFIDTVTDFIGRGYQENEVTKLATEAFVRTYREDDSYVEAFEKLPSGIDRGMSELIFGRIPNYIEKLDILRVNQLPQAPVIWEVAVQAVPQPIQDEFTERPYLVVTYMIASATEEAILSVDIAQITNPEFIQKLFIETILKEKERPEQVVVAGDYSKWLHAYLEKLALDLDVELDRKEEASYVEAKLEEFSTFSEEWEHSEDELF